MDALTPSNAARDAPDKIALIAGDQSWTFTHIAERARRMTPDLEAPRSFVGSPSPAAIFSLCAALEARVPVIPMHPRWSDAECKRARALVPATIRAEHTGSPQDLAAILFTSGTSAAPKGVLLPRRSFLASAAAHSANLPFEPDDRWLLMMPISHAGGLSIVTRALASRTAVVLLERFDPEAVLRVIAEQRVSLLSVVPTMLTALLEHDREGVMRLPRAVLVGGAAMPRDLRARCVVSGVRALATYGLTETCSQIATQSPGNLLDPESSDSGMPLQGVELRVVDGRIQVRGEMLMRGYVGAPPLEPGEWFDTGDEGALRADGNLVVRGRADDTIVTGGENVHPAEVEEAHAVQPGVRAVAVVGCPDERWGQLVTAVLVLEPGAEAAAILDAANTGLASFKRPRQFAIADALPLGATGKIDRKKLLRDIALGTLRVRPVTC